MLNYLTHRIIHKKLNLFSGHLMLFTFLGYKTLMRSLYWHHISSCLCLLAFSSPLKFWSKKVRQSYESCQAVIRQSPANSWFFCLVFNLSFEAKKAHILSTGSQSWRPNHTLHRKVYFNEVVQNSLRYDMSMIIFDLHGYGGC